MEDNTSGIGNKPYDILSLLLKVNEQIYLDQYREKHISIWSRTKGDVEVPMLGLLTSDHFHGISCISSNNIVISILHSDKQKFHLLSGNIFKYIQTSKVHLIYESHDANCIFRIDALSPELLMISNIHYIYYNRKSIQLIIPRNKIYNVLYQNDDNISFSLGEDAQVSIPINTTDMDPLLQWIQK